MKFKVKLEAVLISLTILFTIIIFSYTGITSYAVNGANGGMGGSSQSFGNQNRFNGPSSEDIQCMESCILEVCTFEDEECMLGEKDRCGNQCEVDVSGPPAPSNEKETCMQQCILVGCSEYNFECQQNNMESCEEECNMRGDSPDISEMSEEQKCIHECVMEKNPEIRCQNSPEGEIGDRICKKCAKQCEYLYEGPCLGDKEIKQRQKDCGTCEHCYGDPLMGDSGEGWECIVDVRCMDASSEWGDNPGEGPGIC